MVVGDPAVFAIESEMTYAYDRLSQRALGFFVLHIAGRCYGIKEWNATMLALPFDEVGRRITRRGRHDAMFAIDASAADIAYSFRRAIYDERGENELFFGLSDRQFTAAIHSGNHELTACADEAFDDGSHVLQFENGNRVRLIAFTSTSDCLYDPASLHEVWLNQDEFYGILQEWHDRFNDEWTTHPKVSGTVH